MADRGGGGGGGAKTVIVFGFQKILRKEIKYKGK